MAVAPESANELEFVWRAILGVLMGLATAVLLLLMWNLIRAPYRQRDEIEVKYEELVHSAEEQERSQFYLEFNDNSLTTEDGRILLGVTFQSEVDVFIEKLELEVNDQAFRPLDWVPFRLRQIHNKNYTFDLVAIRTASNTNYQEARFLVRADGTKHESEPFEIHALL